MKRKRAKTLAIPTVVLAIFAAFIILPLGPEFANARGNIMVPTTEDGTSHAVVESNRSDSNEVYLKLLAFQYEVLEQEERIVTAVTKIGGPLGPIIATLLEAARGSGDQDSVELFEGWEQWLVSRYPAEP